jgi:23S rRNA pseudouridine1911/1915/1917 synthase
MTKTSFSPLHLRVTVTEPEARLDLLVQKALEAMNRIVSRAQLKKWFQNGQVTYRERAISASHSLPLGEHEITLLLSTFTSLSASASPKGCFLPVMYEDAEILILNKNHGTPSLPHSPEETETAVNAALAHEPSLSGIGERPLEPGLLHRLDTETSGLLVFAKTQSEFKRLTQIWKSREIDKIYRAITTSPLPFPRTPLTITLPLAHHPKSQRKMIALPPDKTRLHRGNPIPAITRILQATPLGAAPLTDLTIQIETGVMHQIRCHLSSLGHPIWGDLLYGPADSDAPRMALHAWKLRFKKQNGEILEVEAPLPELWQGH